MDELTDLTQPHQNPVFVPAGTPTVSLDGFVERAQRMYPALHPDATGYDDDEPRVFVTMTKTENPMTAADLHEIPCNQHTDQQLVMGVMAVSFALSLVSGVLVYGPFMRRLDFGTYRTNVSERVRWFDLHNLLEVVTLSWALVVPLLVDCH